jgi:hypothetical protein
MGVFIKLGPKHASKDEIELAVFEVLGEFLLGVRHLGLLFAVLSSKLRSWYPPSFTPSAIVYTEASMQSIQAHTILSAELKEK